MALKLPFTAWFRTIPQVNFDT